MQDMNRGLNSQGGNLNRKTNFFPGAVANPSAINLPAEIERMKKKVQAGARFFQTQPIFNPHELSSFLKKASEVTAPMLISFMPLKSYQNCLNMNRNIPGLFVPANIMERFKNSSHPEEEGIKTGLEFWEQARELVPGIHFFPHLNFEATLELIKEIRKQKKT
jgi:5,10-methylenetetrahydrofolate reductase